MFFQTSSPLEVPLHTIPGRAVKRVVTGMDSPLAALHYFSGCLAV